LLQNKGAVLPGAQEQAKKQQKGKQPPTKSLSEAFPAFDARASSVLLETLIRNTASLQHFPQKINYHILEVFGVTKRSARQGTTVKWEQYIQIKAFYETHTLSSAQLREIWYRCFEALEVSKGSGRVPRHLVHDFFEQMSRGDPAGIDDAGLKDS